MKINQLIIAELVGYSLVLAGAFWIWPPVGLVLAGGLVIFLLHGYTGAKQ